MVEGVGGDVASANRSTVFVSYASQDAALAKAVVGVLERARLACWIAPRDIVPGSLYADEIVRAINQCSLVVLVLSGQSVASPHVGKELELASSKRRRIIALRTDAAALPLVRLGQPDRAREVLAILGPDETYGASLSRALFHTWCGEIDLAAHWFGKSIEERDSKVLVFLQSAIGESIRRSPRWPGLAAMVNMSEATALAN
jgi:hypothetical protein